MPEESALLQLVRGRYPFPIGHAYTYMESRIDPGDRYLALLTCFEVTLKTIASIALANFVRDIQQDPQFGNVHLFQGLTDTLDRPLSLGHWHELLRLTLRPYHAGRERLVVPPLFDFYYRVTEQGNVKTQQRNASTIQRFIEERNEEAHHRNRSQTSTFQRRSALGELKGELDALLGELEFLGNYPLLYVEHAEHRQGQWDYRANFASGNNYPFPQGTWSTSLAVNSHRCLLIDEPTTAVLELDPFMIISSEGRLQQPDIFFFDGIFRSGRANFVSYHVSDYVEPTDEGSPASVASDAMNSLLKLLRNRIPAAAEGEPAIEARLSPVEIYRDAATWASEHGERQSISLDALRQILEISREEALKQERELEAERGVEVEPEAEVPFEGEPSWANLAYYVLDSSDREEMYYKDIAAQAEALKDEHDPDWEKGDSASVEATISQVLSRDPRFYKLRRGYYRLTKQNELLSNPSWANLAYFVLQRHDPRRRGMHLQEITEKAVLLKEKYSDWHRASAQTPSNTVSATMSMDHRFESMRKRGHWRIPAGEVERETRREPEVEPAISDRDRAYSAVLERLRKMGTIESLPFGRTYYVLADRAHLMFRFSKAHHRNNEIEFFLGVTPQYFERIRALGHAFLVLVLGAADNVLLVPAQVFAEWVQDLETSGSGTWPMAFYQTLDRKRIERWVLGEGRDDVTAFRNAYKGVEQILSPAEQHAPERGTHRTRRAGAPIRVKDLLQAGLLRPGDIIHSKRHPEASATVVDDKFVQSGGRRWGYTEWGIHITGWQGVNIYREFVLDRTGKTLDELRDQLGAIRRQQVVS
ncbi:MAG: hypothetical protein JXA14_21435 [Anaerolineae bacterium]|nr:hypothetical protein [Anaerolineae bacterium]